MAKLVLSKRGEVEDEHRKAPELHIASCTGREILQVVFRPHEIDGHSLDYVSKENRRLRFQCSCGSTVSFTKEAIMDDFGYSLDALWGRIQIMSASHYVRG